MLTGCHCNRCKDKLCMHKVPILASLDKEDMEKIADLITHHIFKKGEILYREGDRMDSIVIIHEGSAKAYKTTADGREQILYVFTDGDFFGEQNLFRNQYITYTVEALQTLKTCHLSKQQFHQLLYSFPEIAVKIIDELGSRMSRLETALQSMGVRNVDSRIAGILMEFASKYGTKEPAGTVIHLPLSREGIANYLGVARETVSRKFSQLESEGVIRSRSKREILILNPETLQTLAGAYE